MLHREHPFFGCASSNELLAINTGQAARAECGCPTGAVNYLVEDGRVYMGIDGLWWRAFQGEGNPVTLFIQGEQIEGHATVILDDPARVNDVFSRLRPTVPQWLPDQLNGKLVEVRLADESSKGIGRVRFFG